jgi:hypothetical protein
MEQSAAAEHMNEETSLTTAGQRKVNLIWEFTQSAIAILIVVANVVMAVGQGFVNSEAEFPDVLSSMAFLVLGFYFARTNHQAIGGIGRKPEQPYQGR